MKHEVFVKETELLFDKCLEIMNTKGVEYAAGEDDKFANFKRLAAMFGCTPEEICMIYLQKHLDSITNVVRRRVKGEEALSISMSMSEPFTLRIADAINYLSILCGIFGENCANKSSEGVTNNETSN